MSAQPTPPPPAKPASLWIAVALALVTLAVYCPVTGFQFIEFDDPVYIAKNPHVQAGLTAESFKWAWHSEVLGNWHPITMLTLMLDCQLFGGKPGWPHLVNALLHMANTVLLFGLLKRMTGATWRSAIVAALFALHPLHVESVAWVAERKDVLSTLFWLLTTWAYVRYAEKWRVASGQWPVFYGLSLVFFGLGLMSKPMLVTLPFTLLLLDYWPLGRTWGWRLVKEKIPFFTLSAALCVVTFHIQKHSGVMQSLQELPLGERFGNALVSYVRYIEMMLWPRHLAGLYITSGKWPWWEVALAALLLLAVSVLVLGQRRRRPYLAMGWFWYLGTLVPVIGLVQVWIQAVADRYTYVPLIGLFVILVWGGWELAGVWRLVKFAPAATIAALAACAALTVHQEFFWKDSEAYNLRIIAVTPNNYIAHYDLGDFYLKANRTDEALSNFMAAVEEKPDYIQAHNNLGGIFLHQGRFDEAIEHFRTAARLAPDYLYCFNLANALAAAAESRKDTNELAEAVRTFRQAVQLKPGSSEAHHYLGMALQTQGRAGEALAEFEHAALLNSNRVDTWTKLGFAYAKQNRIPEAERAFRELIRLQPGDAAAHFNLAQTLARQSKRDEAKEHYRQALRINPNFAEAGRALSALEAAPDSRQGGKP